jgi:hypothetical protein
MDCFTSFAMTELFMERAAWLTPRGYALAMTEKSLHSLFCHCEGRRPVAIHDFMHRDHAEKNIFR